MRWEEFAPPCPLHPAVAGFTRPVEIAHSTHGLVDDRIWLESIGQHDVRIHGRHVEVIDQWFVSSFRIISHLFELALDLGLDVKVVGHLVKTRLGFLNDAKGQGCVQIIYKLG